MCTRFDVGTQVRMEGQGLSWDATGPCVRITIASVQTGTVDQFPQTPRQDHNNLTVVASKTPLSHRPTFEVDIRDNSNYPISFRIEYILHNHSSYEKQVELHTPKRKLLADQKVFPRMILPELHTGPRRIH